MRIKHYCMRVRLSCRLFSLIAFPALVASLFAQAVTTDATTLAKYDKNKNGRLDPDELAAMQAASPKAPEVASAKGGVVDDEVVALSPFEVISETGRGYYGANTTAGTRLNSNLEDLASSTTIVTKQQMADFAALNLNDIFTYEVGTEGSGTYTDAAFDNKGSQLDNTSVNPNVANRVRGVGAANIALGNFASNNYVPVDPIAIDGVEVSRGPNSSIFGIGEVSGTVNLQPASANLFRDRATAAFRADSYDGYRASLDVNRVLKRGKLAIRGSAVFQHDGFVRKPSGVDSVRLNGMLRYQPFSKTILTASFGNYRSWGTMDNKTMPRDGMAGWKAAGSPTWDPVTATAKINGVAVPGTWTVTNLPSYFSNSQFIGASTLFVQPDGTVSWWGPSRTTSTTNPNTANQNVFFVNTVPSSIRSNQPLFAADPVIGSKSIYDYTSINLAAGNQTLVNQKTATVQLEQTFFNTGRQLLAAQAGFFREDGVRRVRDMIGTAGSSGPTGYLFVDVNERMVDGTTNPNFLRPFLGVYAIRERRDNFSQRDTARGQLAYRLDLRNEKNLLSWLGMHTISLYDERRRTRTRINYWQDDVNDSHSWYPFPTTPTRATNFTVPAMAAQPFYRFYVGDNQGQNIDYAPHARNAGKTIFSWGDGVTGAFNREPAELGYQYVFNNTLGWNSNVLKTDGGTVQSSLFKDRIVATYGLRKDRTWDRTQSARFYSFGPDGYTIDQSSLDLLSTAAAVTRQGKTRTAGVVVKVMPWLRLTANKSDSFTVSTLNQINLFRELLPNPSGKGTDYGLSMTLLNGKMTARLVRYTTFQLNSRSGSTGGIAQRLQAVDLSGTTYVVPSLFGQAKGWVTRAAAAKGQTLSPDQLDQQISAIMKLDPAYWDAQASNSLTYAPSDVEARGYEFELNYNATKDWTVKFNLTESESIDKNISKNILDYYNLRLPVWQSIIDPELGTPWITGRYGLAQSASEFLQSSVIAPLNIGIANEGKSRPEIRKYRFNLLSSYKLSGVSENRWLKNMTVGGALRWEDKGAIGYYGVADAAGIYQSLDAKRPVYDAAHTYVDLFASYRTKLFRDKVGVTYQLNVRNLQDSGGLRPTSAYPDGTPNAYRIIDPRQFILTATFDL